MRCCCGGKLGPLSVCMLRLGEGVQLCLPSVCVWWGRGNGSCHYRAEPAAAVAQPDREHTPPCVLGLLRGFPWLRQNRHSKRVMAASSWAKTLWHLRYVRSEGLEGSVGFSCVHPWP